MDVVDVQERFRLIAETITEVFWMATLDMRQILYVSPAYERIWGRSVEDLYQNPRAWLDAIHPDDRDHIEQAVLARAGNPYDHEYRIVNGDQETRWIWDRGYPIRDEGGRLQYYAGVAQDITERKNVGSELTALGERLRLVLQATHDGLWDWDIVSNTAWWSDTYYTMFGYDRAMKPSFEGWSSRIHPDDRERVLASFAVAIDRAEHQWSEEYRLVIPDGRTLDVFDRAYVVHDASGRPMRMLGAMMDITARRALETQLRQNQKMEAIGRLAGGIAHDFNNILQSALLDLAMLKRTPGLSAAAANHAQAVHTAVHRAASLTRQLLVFSRREAMRPQPTDLNAAIVDVARMLGRILGEDVTLELSLGSGRVTATVDRSMLDQVLINLAVNARDAMPRGGTLSISTTVADHPAAPGHGAGRFACIAVRDTGGGIAPELQSRIFEPFFTTKESGRGTGLGLAIVHGIVEQHRGWIAVDSELDRGSTFRVYLPASNEATASEAPPSREPPRARPDETILLVEDDDQLRRAVRVLLEQSGYRVIEADRAASALLASEREHAQISAMLTDVVMPGGMSGYELARRLAAQRPDLKVIFMTGYSRDLEAMEPDHNAALVHKPIDPDQLLGAVRRCLDGERP